MDAFVNAATLRYRLDGYDASENVSVEGCSDILACRLEDLPVGSGGRILECNIRLRNVCPGKRTALAIELHELDEDENEYPRGLKAFTLPAHNESGNRDILVENIRFVLPDDDSAGECRDRNGVRRFVVRKTTHYVDRNDSCPVKCKEE